METDEEARNEIYKTIDGDLKVNQQGVRTDWNRAQFIAWLSLITSFFGTVWTATGYYTHIGLVKITLAVMVAVPGLMVAVESGFQYSTRVKVYTTAIYTLSRFQMRIRKGKDPYVVADSFYNYMIDYEATFPSGSASSKLNIGVGGGRSSGANNASSAG